MKPRKIGFYPCCAGDIHPPLEMLKDYVDEVWYCDIDCAYGTEVEKLSNQEPEARFICGDVREVINNIERIDALFYRRDSGGEGGSGVFVFGDSFLPRIMERFSPDGGVIITDGSNSRGGVFRKMQKEGGFEYCRRIITLANNQPFRENEGLFLFDVSPAQS